jgi:hypothetical protein
MVEKGNSTLLPLIMDFVNATDRLQRLDTPSGGYRTGGIGEPKFNVDHTAFTGNWGRPQRVCYIIEHGLSTGLKLRPRAIIGRPRSESFGSDGLCQPLPRDRG